MPQTVAIRVAATAAPKNAARRRRVGEPGPGEIASATTPAA
jgi:hypothetical protein